MWPRVVEAMLGCWLVLSPLIFRGTPELGAFIARDAVCGSLIVALSLACFWRPLRWLHFFTALLALWLIGVGYLAASRPGPPGAQNEIITGLLLLMFAVIPNEADLPPEPWRRESKSPTTRAGT